MTGNERYRLINNWLAAVTTPVNKYAADSRKSQRARVRYQMCERKRAFPSRAAAEVKGQDVYRCKFCRQYHRTGSVATLANTMRKRKKP